MTLDVETELARLRTLPVRELRLRYEEVFQEACRSHHKQWLVKRIIWRLQAQAAGDLSERARQRAALLANDADLRMSPPVTRTVAPLRTAPESAPRDPRLPAPGTVLTRTYKGQQIEVLVLQDGFSYAGQVYASLTAVARTITGTHTNGYHFFHLGKDSLNA